MNVKQLKEAIAELPDDMLVLVSRDEDGNGFKELIAAQVSDVAPYYGKEFDVIHPDDVPDHDPAELKKMLVLWP
jgi:hypothetical protein